MEEKIRPIGISIIASLQLVFGVIGLVSLVVLAEKLFRDPDLARDMETGMFGIPPMFVVAAGGVLVCLAIAAGVGLWIGEKWGWYVACFCFAYSAFRSVWLLSSLPILGPRGTPEITFPTVYLCIKHGLRTAVQLLLFRYMFSVKVKDYFSVDDKKAFRSVPLHLALCGAFTAAFYVLAKLSQ